MSKPAIPKTCVVCGSPLTGRQTKRCAKHLKWTYYKTCACGCGISFYTPHKNQRFLNHQHQGEAQRGKKSPRYKHGYFMRDAITKKQDPKKVWEFERLNPKPFFCPNCKQTKQVPRAYNRKFCSHRCGSQNMAKGRKRDSLGRFV